MRDAFMELLANEYCMMGAMVLMIAILFAVSMCSNSATVPIAG